MKLKISWHPHANEKRKNASLNTIYLASDKLLETDIPGFGVFNYFDDLVLTKKGYSRSHWILPDCLVGKEISYHNATNYKDGYFQSAMRGQEFVVDADESIIRWLLNLI